MVRLVIVLALLSAGGTGPEPAGTAGRGLEFTVKPAAAGRQLVRMSLPFPPGLLPEGHGLVVSDGQHEIAAAVRVLTWHPAGGGKNRSARRALVTFPRTFADRKPVSFVARPTSTTAAARGEGLPVEVKVDGSTVTIAYRGGPTLTARLLAPARTSDAGPATETVESNAYFLWQRVRLPDPQWPRIIEVRADAMGGVTLVAHLQTQHPG